MVCVDAKERREREAVMAEAKTFSCFLPVSPLPTPPDSFRVEILLGAHCFVLVSVTTVVTTAACEPCFVPCCCRWFPLLPILY